MGLKLAMTFGVFCLVCCILEAGGTFIKANNVPRVGRSNEADGPFGDTMGYVIKTIPNKNIPRMGRRNFDSGNHYDIPKLYQVPVDKENSLFAVETYEELGQVDGY